MNSSETGEGILILKPMDVPDTTNVMVKAGGEREIYHITRGEFESGDVDEVIGKRFSYFDHLDVDEPKTMPLVPEENIAGVVEGLGGYIIKETMMSGEEKLRVVFPDGETGDYWVDMKSKKVVVTAQSDPKRDGQASRILMGYFEDARTIEEIDVDTGLRDEGKVSDGDTSVLEREARRAHERGYVITENGRKVEPDHPESPLRKAGMI